MNREQFPVWFRHDLRLHDSAARAAALQRGKLILPVFIKAPFEEGDNIS